MQENRIFDPSSNLDWQEEVEWGQRYIQQFNIRDTSVEVEWGITYSRNFKKTNLAF